MKTHGIFLLNIKQKKLIIIITKYIIIANKLTNH